MRDLTFWIGAILLGGLLSAQTDRHPATDLHDYRESVRAEMREVRMAEREAAESLRAAAQAQRRVQREMANETRAMVREELRHVRDAERELRRDLRDSYR
jgi:hypothetical protein